MKKPIRIEIIEAQRYELVFSALNERASVCGYLLGLLKDCRRTIVQTIRQIEEEDGKTENQSLVADVDEAFAQLRDILSVYLTGAFDEDEELNIPPI